MRLTEPRIVQLIASGVSWREVLDALCRLCEAEQAGVRASVVVVENGATMHVGAAPSMPAEFKTWLDGTRIGPNVGSCGTAAYTKQRVIVEDIASDPLWALAGPVALRFGVRACFATPVLADDGEALGSFGMYFLTPRGPTHEQLELADRVTSLASVVLQRRRSQRRREELEARVEQRTLALERTLDELRREHESARAASAAKSALLADLSHEIRTPMNAILGFAQVLAQHGGLTPLQAEQLDAIRGSGEHLLGVVDDVLQMAKLESGKLEGARHDIAVSELLHDVERMFVPQVRSKGLELVVHVASDVPARITSDRGKLRQVLINLVGNALKFTAQGTVTLRVGRSPASTRPSLRFSVRDTGVGISEQDQQGLFQAFFQAGEATQRALGTGLGLAISKRLVEHLGGELQVKSTLGVGSAFWFDLPLHVAHEEACPPQGEPRVSSLLPRPDLTVLIVDDHDLNRRVLVELLRPFGFHVLEAKDGVEALVAFERHQPQLVLMDLRMPRMDGYEAMQRIRQSPGGAAVRIVAVTASAFDVDLLRIRASGADDILRKPFRREKLLRIVEAQLMYGAHQA